MDRIWFRSSVLFALAVLITSCSPVATAVDPNTRVNAGVNIVPDAVLASQKMRPSSQLTDDTQTDLIDVISDSDQKHSRLVELLRNAGLVPTLQCVGPYTVLAPTDEAFSKLPPGVMDRLLQPAHHNQLVAFVKYHLLAGKIGFTELLQTNGRIATLDGPDVIVKGIGSKAMVNDANVLRSDMAASNGVIHWLDNVLIPPM